MEPQLVLGTQEGDPLQTKYTCIVEKSTTMNVTMELTSTQRERTQRLPLRHVLVIDVSDSMNERIGVQQRTLLQRVQLFAELAVRKVSEDDWLAIVSFSGDCKEEMEMQRMYKSNKQMARNTLRSLSTRGNTNLEAGLLGALKIIEKAPKPARACRDCIILFTDGEANDGQTDARLLIQSYRRTQTDMHRMSDSSVPVSAFTIGGYRPDLLIEISQQLGSESFYWLNDEEDFEADMLIPLFLREVTNITDVDITIQATSNCYFDPVDYSATYLKGIRSEKIKVIKKKKKQKIKVPIQQNYFIHSLPGDNSKNISFDVALPQIPPEHLRGLRVIEVTVRYLNHELRQGIIRDSILLNLVPLNELRQQAGEDSIIDASILNVLRQFSAFSITRDHMENTWNEAQEAIIKWAEEKCKRISVQSILNAKQYVGKNDSEVRKCFQQALHHINNIRSQSSILLPDPGENRSRIAKILSQWTVTISQANDISATNDARNYSRLTSMVTSICTENPTSGGVFRGNQPFMSSVMAEKLLEEKRNLAAVRRLHSGGEIDVGTAKHRAQQAIRAGDLNSMESSLQDLKALELFEGEVGEDFLSYVEREIVHRKLLNGLKRNLNSSLSREDFSETEKFILQIREMKAMSDLTFTSDDNTTLQTAAEALRHYKWKRNLRGDIASIMPNLILPVIPANMDTISKAIQTLVRLRNDAKNLKDVFTDRDNATLNIVIANVNEAKKDMDLITRKMNEARPILNYARRPSNYEAILGAIDSMEEAKSEAEKYNGLFTDRDESLLKTAYESRTILSEEKARLEEKIQEIKPSLELPMLPRNFNILSEAVNKMTSIQQRAKGFKDVFTQEHDALLNQASSNVAILMTKRDEIVEKLSRNMLNARLPKLPSNLDKLIIAVEEISEAREEAKGFENVYTEEHAKILQSAEGSMQILMKEKEEVIKEQRECVDNLQLPMVAASYIKICDGVDTFKRITPELKGFGLYEKEYDSLLEKAEFNREVLSGKRQQIMNNIQELKHHLRVDLIPENLEGLRTSVEKMKILKEAAQGYENAFTKENEVGLFEAMANLNHLTSNVDKMNDARQKLEYAVEKQSYTRLKHAIKTASKTLFISPDELKKPRKLMSFVNPKNRKAAVKSAIEQGDIEAIEEALLKMREARVNDDNLEQQAQHALKVLRKQKRREERERRRIERERIRRQREMDRIESSLSLAIETRDLETMEQALQEFEDSEFNDNDITIATEAKELLSHLKIEHMRKRLQDCLRRRDVEGLYSALMEAKFGHYEEHMKKEYDEAEGLLVYLLEMMRLREEIMKMTRASISEVHGYPSPPKSILKIMKATYTILGEPISNIKTWVQIQALMGRLDRNSITKRVRRFRIKSLSPETAERAEKFLSNLYLEEVEGVSKVAATFYAWARYVVKEVGHFQELAEKREREIEEAEKAESENYEDENFESDHEGSANNQKDPEPEEEEEQKEAQKREEKDATVNISDVVQEKGADEQINGAEQVVNDELPTFGEA